jgi:hypothetical protein
MLGWAFISNVRALIISIVTIGALGVIMDVSALYELSQINTQISSSSLIKSGIYLQFPCDRHAVRLSELFFAQPAEQRGNHLRISSITSRQRQPRAAFPFTSCIAAALQINCPDNDITDIE